MVYLRQEKAGRVVVPFLTGKKGKETKNFCRFAAICGILSNVVPAAAGIRPAAARSKEVTT